MKLLSCHVVNFGCLCDLRLTFADGINLILAENGAGKTTLVAFLKAMLYGLPATRVTDIQKNERARYLPWQGGRYGGSLTFEIPEGVFRIERFFGAKAKEDTVTVYDNATNTATDRFGESVGDALFAVDEEGFERTLYISQRAPGFDPDNATIRTRLGTLTRAADDLGDFTGADEHLHAAIKRYQNGRSAGKLAELAARDEQVRQAILAAEGRVAEYARLGEEIELARAKRRLTEGEAEALREEKQAAAERRLRAEQRASYLRLRAEQDRAMRELVAYEELFRDAPPTEERLAAAENDLAVAEAARAKEAAARLSDEMKARLDTLRAVYGDAPPDEALLSRLQAAEDAARRAEERAEEYRPRHTDGIAELRRAFPQGAPDKTQTEALTAALAEEAEVRRALQEKSAAERSPLWALLCAVLTAVCGVGGALLSALPVLMVILLSLSALSLLGTVGLLLLPRIRRRHLYRAHSAARAAILPYLTAYITAEKDPVRAAEGLLADAARLSEWLAEDGHRAEERAVALSCREQALRETREALSGYRFSDGIPPLHHIRAEATELSHLLSAERQARTTCRAEAERAEQAEGRLHALFSIYPLLSELSARAALSRLQQSLPLCRKAAEAVRESGAALQDFLSASGYDPSLPLPPPSEDEDMLRHREREIGDRLTRQTAEIATLEERRLTLEDSHAELDRLRAERLALEEERAAAAHTHALLVRTKQILTDAKVDLTTRYLRHMEKTFDGYMAHLSDTPETFLFDAEMNLLTERLGERRSVEQLSRGQRDLALFCARLSLVDAVFRAEPPFFLLDDPFVNLDDGNYTKAAALLTELAKERQVLLTVCTAARRPAGAHALSLTV